MMFPRGLSVSVALVLLLSIMPLSVFAGSSYTARQAPWGAIRAVACFELTGKSGCPARPAVGVCKSWSVCPVTFRLGRRFIVEGAGPGGARPGCDCQPIVRAQFMPASASIGRTVSIGDRARANVTYDMGVKGYGPARETFVAVRRSAGWQVANIYCTGKPQTTIFHDPLEPCYTSPAAQMTRKPE